MGPPSPIRAQGCDAVEVTHADDTPLTTAHDRWVDRDAAVVWHGFTQMSTYAENRPVIVESAEGRELIDVDGTRYLDAISSLWVTTLGHGVPELDAAAREQLDRVAHSTMLGNGNRTTIELAEALAPRVPVSEPHFLFASDGAAAVEQAIKIAFQYWTNQGIAGRSRYLALGGAYHGDTIGSISIGAGGFGTDVFDPLRFDVLRAPGYDDPGWADTAVAMIRTHAHELAAVVIEPLVQGAAGMWVTDPESVERVGDACREHNVLLIADEVATGFGRTGTLFATEQCRIRPEARFGRRDQRGVGSGHLRTRSQYDFSEFRHSRCRNSQCARHLHRGECRRLLGLSRLPPRIHRSI